MNRLPRQPAQRLFHRAHGGAGWQLRPVDQDDRAAQLSRGRQLGLGAQPPRVLGHEMGDAVALHQFQILVQGEGAAINDHDAPIFGQRHNGIDQAQKVPVPGLREEGLHMLAANRQKHARRTGRQGCQGACHVGGVLPNVTALRLPGRALQCQQGQGQFATDLHRMATHLGGKRVRGVDHVGDGLRSQVIAQPRYTAEAADPGRQGLRQRCIGAPGVRKNSIHAGRGQCLGELAGFGGATQQEDTLHG